MLLFTGCDTTESDTDELVTCGDLFGSFSATSMSVESVGDPDVNRTFEGASWEIILSGANRFSSQFIGSDNEAVTVIGTYSFTGESTQAPGDLILGSEALLPGIQPNSEQRFTCELEDNGFSLSSLNMDYDFDGDGTYEDAEYDFRFRDLE